MAKAQPKISLSEQRAIPLDKLVLSQSNVRQVKAGVAIEQLAEDIARRTLLQSLTVRPVLDEAGAETGIYEVPAGGRRFRALELLAKQKRLAKNAPIPCIVRTEGLAEEDSLAENVQRAPLHPLDQFRAFQAMREKGMGEEEIAAAFFVSVAVVKQRLRLAAVSPALLDVYAEDGITLDQLMAFTVNPDHQRQEQVWEAIQVGYGGRSAPSPSRGARASAGRRRPPGPGHGRRSSVPATGRTVCRRGRPSGLPASPDRRSSWARGRLDCRSAQAAPAGRRRVPSSAALVGHGAAENEAETGFQGGRGTKPNQGKVRKARHNNRIDARRAVAFILPS